MSRVARPLARAAEWPRRQAHPPSLPWPRAAVHPVRRTTVSVLNGTTVTGLARAAADTLFAGGFRAGVITNDTTNQQRPLTEIYYEPGYREQAQTAAGCLEVGLNRIHPMNANARVAGDRADIVVFMGADKAK